MRTRRTKMPELNTGSMADIAFLLLIFFLVTAMIPNDKGINRKLPKLCLTNDCTETYRERNVLRISINKQDAILLNDALIEVALITETAKEFIDNNGDNSCDYCHGLQVADASENPKKAIISLASDRATSYKTFIAVQDALTKAYFELRIAYAQQKFEKPLEALTSEELKEVKQAYPFIISEAEITSPN